MLIIDNCCRFMSTKTVLSKMNEIFDETEHYYFENGIEDQQGMISDFQDKCKREFLNTSVIANYGLKKTYVIKDVCFDMGPCQTFFQMKDGSKVSVAKYFYKTYKLKISDTKQPMLVMLQQGKKIYVPSEFCIMDGVPDSIRNNGRDMRSLLDKTRQDPS